MDKKHIPDDLETVEQVAGSYGASVKVLNTNVEKQAPDKVSVRKK